MCGIAGFLTAGQTPDGQLLRAMCDRLAHRGPDAYGAYLEGPIALGHRRLSIIDLSTGDQPMANEDGSIQVIFNGEIYNYRELRSELVAQGHQFKTSSDTEVLVHLYEEAGSAMAGRLNGMFAFAIWDSRKRELLLARDRFGKKPLYYSLSIPGMPVAFASELKALTGLPGFSFEADVTAVADFLCLSYIADPHTIYRQVRKLPPAHTLTIGQSSVMLRRYWSPRFSETETDLDQATAQIQELARDAVERRMISDVPLGGFLSGGVDSSAVVGLMAGSTPRPVQTFSIGFTNKRFDELNYASAIARRYGTDHREQVVSMSVHEMLAKLIEHFDEPFGDASAIPTLYLARMTRQHVTVALCGDGADELFGGYRRYYYGVLEQKLRERFPRWFRHSVLRAGGRYYPKFDYLPQVFRAKTLLGNLARELGDAYFTSMTAFRDENLESVLAPELRRELGDYSPRAAYRARFEAVRELPPLQQMQAVDLETYLPGDILVKADRSTMAYSLETRSPWLDYRLGELACALPAGFKCRGKVGKYIFKRAMAPYVPAEVLTRTKMGFAVPLGEWFRTSLRSTFENTVMGPGMCPYVSVAEVRRIWRQHQSGRYDHSRKLWNLLMLTCWEAHHRRNRPSAAAELALAAQ